MVSRWCGWAALYTALVQLVPAFGMSWTVVNEDADTDGNPTNVGDYAMVTTKDRNRIWFYDGSGQTDTEIFYMDVSGASGFAWVKLAVDNTNGPGDQWSLSAAMDSNNVIWLYGGNAGSQDVHTIDVSAATASTTTLAVVLRSANNRPTAPGLGREACRRAQRFVQPMLSDKLVAIFPQQRKLMGSSAQISSGVCRRGSQEQVPEEGSGRFQRVLWCVAVGSAGGFRKVPESSGVCWCRFRRRVPEGSGEFRREASSGRFLKVSGVCWCRFWRRVPEGSGKFRRMLV